MVSQGHLPLLSHSLEYMLTMRLNGQMVNFESELRQGLCVLATWDTNNSQWSLQRAGELARVPAEDGLLHAMLMVACLDYEKRDDGIPVSIRTNTRTGMPRVVNPKEWERNWKAVSQQVALEWLAPVLVAAFTLGTILFLRGKPGAVARPALRARRGAKKEK